MKFEKLSIDCGSLKNMKEVFEILDSMGYRSVGEQEYPLFVHTYKDGDYQTYFNHRDHEGSIELTFKEFISKYGKSEMKQSIEKAMKELKMGREELSSALGVSRPYITKMLTRPQSEKTQNKVIKMIDDLIESVNISRQFLDAVSNNPIIIDERDKVIKELNQALEYKDQLLARNEDDLHKQANRANVCKENNLKLGEQIIHQRLVISRQTTERIEIEKLNSDLSDQVKALKRKNKDMDIFYSIICLILTALALWFFYV